MVVTAGILIGTAVVESIGTIVTEALIDTTTDFVMDSTNEVFQKMMPNFSDNQYVKQFSNQVRMGMSTATNARVMSAAIKSQNRIEEKLQTKKTEMKQKFETEKQRITQKSGWNKGAKGKRLKNLEQQYTRQMNELETDVSRLYQMRESSATEAYAFSGGTGALKQGHDGTIQNMKPNPNADLVNSIDKLLNGMGYYPDNS